MPRLMIRQEPSASQFYENDVWCDALLINGTDPAASRRARIRALNTARQAAEQKAPRVISLGSQRLDKPA